MNLEIVMLSEVRQKEIYHITSLNMQNLKYGTSEPIYKIEIGSQT